MYCGQCGKQISDNANFCSSCGTHVKKVSGESQVGTPQGNGPNRSKKPAIIIAVVAVCAIVAVITALTSGFFNIASDESTVRLADGLYYSPTEEEHIVADEETGIEFADNELIVYLVSQDGESLIDEILDRYNGEIVGRSEETLSYQLRFTDTYTLSELQVISNEIEQDSRAMGVSRNVMLDLAPDAVTADPAWNEEDDKTWGLEAINAPEAWDIVTADESIRVGIIDTQFYIEHEDLDDAFVDTIPNYEHTFTAWHNRDDHPDHGTHVAGIIGAESNDAGSVGVSYGCSLYGFTMYGKDANGEEIYTSSYEFDLFITYLVVQNDCRVINISMSAGDSQKKASNGYASAIAELEETNNSIEKTILGLVRKGHDDFIICKCAGNQGESAALAEYDFISGIESEEVASRILVVGSVTQDDEGSISVSNFSSGGERVDVLAPGENIYSTIYGYNGNDSDATPYSDYGYMGGTSMATPMVSGVAALVIAANPDLKGDQIKEIILETASGSYSNDLTPKRGVVDAEAAVELALLSMPVTDEGVEQIASDALEAFANTLDIQQYEVEYQYRYRSYENYPDPWFEWIIGEGIPENAALGSALRDFDSDGINELLVVRWTNGTYDLEIYEAESGIPHLVSAMSDTALLAFPISGNGSIDVLCSDDNVIYIQWWYHTNPTSDYHEWVVMRVDYNGERVSVSGNASVEGTGLLDLTYLKTQMRSLGISVDEIPDESWEFSSSMLIDSNLSFELVTRAVAVIDDSIYYSPNSSWRNSDLSDWSSPQYLGTFTVGPNAIGE